jgi:hypothetical protein
MPNFDATHRRAPASTFHFRPTHDFHPTPTPGPGAYSPITKPFGLAPMFSLHGRAVSGGSGQPNPPYYLIPSTISAGPRISFGGRVG